MHVCVCNKYMYRNSTRTSMQKHEAVALIMVAIQQILDPASHYQLKSQPLRICPLRNADEWKTLMSQQNERRKENHSSKSNQIKSLPADPYTC